MQGVEKIMAAVDFSQYSQATLRMALGLARDIGSALVAVNVLNQRDVEAMRHAVKSGQAMGVSEKDFIARQTRERLQMLADLLRECGADPERVEMVIKVGVPAQEVLEAIGETRADLVVMGAKGRTNLAMALFGSTAERVFRRSPVPVLSVRGAEFRTELGKLGA